MTGDQAKNRGYETIGNERELVDGKLLINRCYDAFIQRFSMFKGESDLKVFDEPTAIKTLVEKFSNIRKFDDIVELLGICRLADDQSISQQ